MTSIVLENVSVEFPIYGAHQRSLRSALFERATGGLIEREGKNQDRVIVKALTDVSLTFEDGDRIGLIGHNGSGKTTLLRLLAGIYEPVAGRLEIRGRVTPLFDVMPGLDPEDTGYENIITSGLLIGLSRQEIEAKIPEIEEFSELGEYLTLPVRTYSLGMSMRLGFALVTALDPDVLLMDEGFGTGDLRFAERAEARMQEFIGRSRVMVLASHSDATIRAMCNKAVMMESGRVVAFGTVDEVCDQYYESVHRKWVERSEDKERSEDEEREVAELRAAAVQAAELQAATEPVDDAELPPTELAQHPNREGTGAIKFTRVEFINTSDEASPPATGSDCRIRIDFARKHSVPIKKLVVGLGIDNDAGQRVALFSSDVAGAGFEMFPPDAAGIEIDIRRLPLLAGEYSFTLFSSINGFIADWIRNAGQFRVRPGDFFGSGVPYPPGQGHIAIDCRFGAVGGATDDTQEGMEYEMDTGSSPQIHPRRGEIS